MNMVLGYTTLDDLDIVGLTALANQLANPFAHLLGKYFVAVFGSPDEVDFQVEDRMRGLSIGPSHAAVGLSLETQEQSLLKVLD